MRRILWKELREVKKKVQWNCETNLGFRQTVGTPLGVHRVSHVNSQTATVCGKIPKIPSSSRDCTEKLLTVTVPRNFKIIGIADAAADAARDGIFKGIRIFWTRLVWSNWT